MKDFKTFAKISAWLSLFVVVFGGIMFAAMWWEYSSATVFVAMLMLYVVLFGVLLGGMLILDALIERQECAITYVRSDIPNRDARCKGYVEFTWKEKK
jgi:hypothetical protein